MGGTIQYVLGFCNEVLRGSYSGAFPIVSNSEQSGSPRPPVTVKILNSNKVAPPVAKSQGAGSDGREGTTNRVPRPGRPPSPLVSDPAPIVTSNPFSALAGLACEDEKAATNVMTSFNIKTRAGKGKRGASRRRPHLLGKLLGDQRIAVANLVAEPDVGRSETETEEASVQPALPTRKRGGGGRISSGRFGHGGCTSNIVHRRVGGIAPSSPFSCDPGRQADGGSGGRIIFYI